MPNGWAFEPQKRPPGQDAPSRSFAVLIASFSRFDRCRGRIVGRSLTPRLLVLQIGDRRLPLSRAESFPELPIGSVKGRWRWGRGDQGVRTPCQNEDRKGKKDQGCPF